VTAEQNGLDPAKVLTDPTGTVLVRLMESAGCPVVIGNGSYNHALLLATHLAPLIDDLATLALDLQGKVARVEAESRWLASGPTANLDTMTRAAAAQRIQELLADQPEQ